jgi:hypothetical protein
LSPLITRTNPNNGQADFKQWLLLMVTALQAWQNNNLNVKITPCSSTHATNEWMDGWMDGWRDGWMNE